MDTNYSIFFLSIYILSAIAILIIAYKNKWYEFNHYNLFKQKIFWVAIFFPILSFLYFGIFCWIGSKPKLDSDGMITFIEISKFPLLCLAMTIPFGAIVSNLHRTYQTEAQIKLSDIKNNMDAYYAHYKHYTEIFSKVESIELNLKNAEKYIPAYYKVNLKILNPHTIYKKSFPKSSPLNGPQYTPSLAIIKLQLNFFQKYIESIESIDNDYLLELIKNGLDKNDGKFMKIENKMKELGVIYGYDEQMFGLKIINTMHTDTKINIFYTICAFEIFNIKIYSLVKQSLDIFNINKKNNPEIYDLLKKTRDSFKNLRNNARKIIDENNNKKP
ncbi:hypothetical protein [Pectobacterium wasabiae]|uniref:hypothetical protein n=1 Tax=Pectobacterium wasabiae TaxID=55208 RepID=UPI00027B0BEA|nr:hypothetical protein [Pectobacterium wasabiae]AOR61692.1 hypothetical protein A7983_00005 [Pectobacterium wasabiae CFBP 3304]EJS95447.1 Hypothetical protein Y17_1265 [Pectobacterium wasabiae CFBP 3304]